MNKKPSCLLNGHGFNSDGMCIYCHKDDGTQTSASNEPDDEHFIKFDNVEPMDIVVSILRTIEEKYHAGETGVDLAIFAKRIKQYGLREQIKILEKVKAEFCPPSEGLYLETWIDADIKSRNKEL